MAEYYQLILTRLYTLKFLHRISELSIFGSGWIVGKRIRENSGKPLGGIEGSVTILIFKSLIKVRARQKCWNNFSPNIHKSILNFKWIGSIKIENAEISINDWSQPPIHFMQHSYYSIVSTWEWAENSHRNLHSLLCNLLFHGITSILTR